MPPSSKKSQQRLRNQSTELPLFKSPLVLRLTADLFRQHADLYQQHAAILERVSANPNSIQAWQLEEPCPERIAARVQEEETTTLALKGYQGMLQVQKRVNHMERLVKRNGVGVKTICQSRTTTKKEQRIQEKEDPTTAIFWFFKHHALRISQELQQPLESSQVRQEVVRIWKMTNPLERKPFVDKAERVKSIKSNDANNTAKVSAVAAAKRNDKTAAAKPKKEAKQELESEASLSSTSSSSSSSDEEDEDEDRLLFQRQKQAKEELSSSSDSDSSDDKE